jgi:hypothetical protein
MRAHIDDAKAGMNGWKQSDFDAMQAEAEAIEAGMAKALIDGLPADSGAVTALMRRQHAWVCKSWNKPAPAAAFAGLGEMYVNDPRFRERYDGRQPGLAEYMAAAMSTFAAREL